MAKVLSFLMLMPLMGSIRTATLRALISLSLPRLTRGV
jgi:hypothetical protein